MSQARETLIADFRATRVSFTWFGVRKSLSAEQRAEAAETFGADGPFLSAGKKLIDTKHKAYREVTGIRTDIRKFWQSCTLPFPEPGVRLIKEGYIQLFDAKLRQFREELTEAVEELDERYHELRQQARERWAGSTTPTTTRAAWRACSRSTGSSPTSRPRSTCGS